MSINVKNLADTVLREDIIHTEEQREHIRQRKVGFELGYNFRNAEVAELRAALQKIANWELPATGKFWDEEQTRPISYETEYGSNGAREYMRNIAKIALV